MFQLTAVCFDAEYAYAEAESFEYALEELRESVAESSNMYPKSMSTLIVLEPSGHRSECKLSMYI